jgi:hypothetical protein
MALEETVKLANGTLGNGSIAGTSSSLNGVVGAGNGIIGMETGTRRSSATSDSSLSAPPKGSRRDSRQGLLRTPST